MKVDYDIKQHEYNITLNPGEARNIRMFIAHITGGKCTHCDEVVSNVYANTVCKLEGLMRRVDENVRHMEDQNA